MELQIITKLADIERMLNEQKMFSKDVLTFDEAALYLLVSHTHLYRLTRNGTLPYYKPQGRKRYFNREELNQWVKNGRQDKSETVNAGRI